jgi:hypothetical protein
VEQDVSLSDDVDDDDSDPSSSRRRPSHRNITTWQDAVGVIVAANIESRAKSPQNGSPGRGGRSRGGRSRGGRGRRGGSNKKSE